MPRQCGARKALGNWAEMALTRLSGLVQGDRLGLGSVMQEGMGGSKMALKSPLRNPKVDGNPGQKTRVKQNA